MQPTFKQFRKQIRDFYETLLVLMMAAMFHLNNWHVLAVLNTSALPKEPLKITGATLAFTVGVCLSLMQHRPKWIKSHDKYAKLILLMLEMFVVLLVVDLIQLEIECTAMNMMQSKYLSFVYELMPNLLQKQLHDAYHFVQSVHAFWLLLASMDSASAHWQTAIEFLIFRKSPNFQADSLVK